jgi:hypothetical protein
MDRPLVKPPTKADTGGPQNRRACGGYAGFVKKGLEAPRFRCKIASVALTRLGVAQNCNSQRWVRLGAPGTGSPQT